MAYQKLQAGRAITVIPSDTIDIPNIAASVISSTTTSATAGKLNDTAGDFINKRVAVGDIIYTSGLATNIAATVTAIDSATVLSVTTAIANSTAYTIYSQAQNQNNGCVLYCGGAGNIDVITSGGDTVNLATVPAGLFIPVQVLRVKATLTTATNIVALW
tara:strand:- start:126 stop:605 length:480 start_codon:yes stop_codon:yes gene_type:complete